MFRTALSAAMSLTLGLYSAEVPPPSASDLQAERQRRLQQLNQEISEFQGNLDELRGQERGVLGELERLETELRLRQKEHQGAAVRLDDVTAESLQSWYAEASRS